MKHLLSVAIAAAMLSSAAIPASLGAGVDNSISPLCRADHAGTGYQRPGGFCDQVAAVGGQGPKGSGGRLCPVGQEPNPTPPPACIPEV